MLNRAHTLRKAISLFVSTADQLYGPITTVRCDGRVVKHIPWSAFQLDDYDWARVFDAKEILRDSNNVLHYFSSEKHPSLWCALPAIEDLQTAWENKLANEVYSIYHPAIADGLKKLKKYYSKFDEKPSFILALLLHPYYKLAYIKMAWGGHEEQKQEWDEGNPDAKDWQHEARTVVDDAVGFTVCTFHAYC
ncbi:hypothetical protein BD779DRAFT_1437956 [Infundibulicybe gibba]|nr:hypothetical protein BD779DRAFT_1437956 [Infundibulicybe gibba]